MSEGRNQVVQDKARGLHLRMNNAEWALPTGFAAYFDGRSGAVTVSTGSAVVTSDMDYSLELWFKTDGPQSNATLLSNGRGDNLGVGSANNTFDLAFDANGIITFTNNNQTYATDGRFDDSNWHHLVMTVNRSTRFAQIFIDGELNTFFISDNIGGVVADSLAIGARRWFDQNNVIKPIYDNFFGGKIDDVRFWELNKTQPIIEEFNNEKLNGNELGLLFYYPFEHYLISPQGTTYQDNTFNNKASDVTAVAVAHNGEIGRAHV